MYTLLSIAMAAVVTVSAAASVATNRFYPDFTVHSPGMKYRLEARSPDNGGGWSRPFAASFVYALYDVTTKTKVWERRQPMKAGDSGPWPDGEASPTWAYVTDDGNVVVATGRDELFVLSPSDGAKMGQINILDQFTRDEHDKYISESTAGPIWEDGSRWSFLTVKEVSGRASLYFVIRPYWEHRVVVEVATGTLVEMGDAAGCGEATLKDPKVLKDSKVAAIVRAIRDDDASWALATLRKASKGWLDRKDYENWWALEAAVAIAGRRGVKDAIPMLRTLEANDHVTSSSSNGIETRELRGVVHTALRRLGEIPASEPAITLREIRRDQWFAEGDLIASIVTIKERAAKADSVKTGMTVHELAAAVGLPDFEVFDETMGYSLDYDMDAAEPFTLRISLDDNKVASVKRITPAVWKDGYERDR